MSDSDKSPSILDDISTSFKSLITERFTSPFLFSFVVSWLIFNHKLLILSFSDATDKFPIGEKFKLFDSVLNSSYVVIPFTHKTLLLNGLLFPLISGVFYTFIYPFADYYITKFTLERKVKLRNLRVQKEHETYYTFDDVQKIYSKHYEDEKRWKLRLDQAELTDTYKDSIIKELQSKIDTLSEQSQKNALNSQDENESKLESARAAIDVGLLNEALKLIDEIVKSGNANQRRRAKALMKKIEAKSAIAINEENKIQSNTSLLTTSEAALLNFLGKAANRLEDWVQEKEVMKIGGLTPVEIKIAIDGLFSKSLIRRQYSNRVRAYVMQLTVDGMKLYQPE